MDIASLSMAMSQQRVQVDASLALMNQTKQLSEDMGDRLIDMLEKSVPAHPTLGKSIDLKG